MQLTKDKILSLTLCILLYLVLIFYNINIVKADEYFGIYEIWPYQKYLLTEVTNEYFNDNGYLYIRKPVGEKQYIYETKWKDIEVDEEFFKKYNLENEKNLQIKIIISFPHYNEINGGDDNISFQIAYELRKCPSRENPCTDNQSELSRNAQKIGENYFREIVKEFLKRGESKSKTLNETTEGVIE